MLKSMIALQLVDFFTELKSSGFLGALGGKKGI